MENSSDDEALAAAAAAFEVAQMSGVSEAEPAASGLTGVKKVKKLQFKLSGRLGATKELAQRQVHTMLELTARVEAAAQTAVDAAADPALTLDEARDHLAGLTGLRDELQAVDLTAIAAADAQPLLMTVEARSATVEALIGVFAVRENRLTMAAAADTSRRGSNVTGNLTPMHALRQYSTGGTPSPTGTPSGPPPAASTPLTGGRGPPPPSTSAVGVAGPPPAAAVVATTSLAAPLPSAVTAATGVWAYSTPLPHYTATAPLPSSAPPTLPTVATFAPASAVRTVPATLGPTTSAPALPMGLRPPLPAPPPQPAAWPATAPTLLPPTAWPTGRPPPVAASAATHFPFPVPTVPAATHAPGVMPGALASGGSTPSSAPPWSTTSNPYVTNDMLLGPDYYASFPYPWNVMPTPTAASHGDMLKVASHALPKFDGHRANYLAWRGTFLPCVHLTTIPLNLKVMLLRSTLKTDTEDMKELAASIVFTAEGYRQTICLLEKDFGGDETLLLVRQEALLELPILKEGDFQNLKTLFKRLGTFLNQWATLNGGALTTAESITFFRQLFNRIDKRYAHKYISWAQEGARERGLQSLHAWLATQYENHRLVAQYSNVDMKSTTDSGSSRHKAQGSVAQNGGARRPSPYAPQSHLDRNYKHHTYQTTTSEDTPAQRDNGRRPPCPKCGGPHTLGRCFKFRDSTPGEKKTFLMDEKRCFLCLATGHTRPNCRADYRCKTCNGKHNTALHDALVRTTSLVTTETGADSTVESATDAEYMNAAQTFVATTTAPTTTRQRDKMRVSLRTVPVWVENPINGRGILANALLDDGCTGGALVSTNLATELLLKGKIKLSATEGVGGKVTEFKTISAPINISPVGGAWKRELLAQVMQNPAGSYKPVDWTAIKHEFPHLSELPLPRPRPGLGVDILLGNQCPFLHTSIKEVLAEPESPAARLTPLGWTVTGPNWTTPGRHDKVQQATLLAQLHAVPQPLTDWSSSNVVDMCLSANVQPATGSKQVNSVTDKQLLKLVENMIRVDDCVQVSSLSPREEYAISQLRKSLHLDNGQYRAACTWAPGGGRPPLNYKQAYNRLVSLEKSKYFKDDTLRVKYGEVIEDWIQKQFVHDVTDTPERTAYLMPHFPILKDSPTTPIRPVMDCKIALNKYLLAGPNLLNNIDDVLLRFRSGLYTFSGDVKQMFLMICLQDEDKPYHCFLWRSNPEEDPRTYQFQVHVFGNTGSPFVAVFVLKEHATKYQDTWPAAVDTLVRSSLIDDILDSTDTLQDAQDIMTQLQNILADAGMRMAKCHSNHSSILANLPQEAVTPGCIDISNICQKDSELVNLKALGIRCDPASDNFFFVMEAPTYAKWTKRSVLKTFPRLFDPLGLLLPFVIRARIYFSSLVLQDLSWDDDLLPDPEWSSWLRQLDHLAAINFPRCIKTFPAPTAELHLFADASEKAYAAAAYIRTEDDRGRITVRLARAKAHVAPLKKPQTIPRLELLAAELSTTLRLQVIKAVKLKITRCIHWIDSTTVLCWINDDKKRFQMFVYNKINNIRRTTVETEWRYVPTAENPADLPSRGTKVEELSGRLWQEGPSFLKLPESEWPKVPPLVKTSAVLQELRKVEQVFLTDEAGVPLLDFDRFSSYTRMLGVVERIFLFVDRWRKKTGRKPMEDVRASAEKFLLLQAQLRFRTLLGRASKSERRSAGFLRITPFQDEQGLWRGEGRLSLAKGLSRDTRQPILLHKSMPLLTLILRHLHEKVAKHYGGPNYLLAKFYARYWAPEARRAANRVVHDCVPCRQQKARPLTQKEGPMPDFRVVKDGENITPFESTGIDCAGPYRVKRGRAYETHYLLILTCCKVRAVRLELLDDLSVDSLLMALTRASARGVAPTEIVTDNGANFEAAGVLVRKINEESDSDGVMPERREIKWRFNPPYASHYGGVFERIVKATKEALYHALPSHMTLTLEQLRTALAVVENVLNCRPLAYVSSDPRDTAPLTPNHFLYGTGALQFFDDLQATNSELSLAKRYNVIKRAMERFAQRFEQEVRPSMQLNNKYVMGDKGRDVAPGDVVVFFMPSSAKKWPLALVTEVYPGRDGRVRTIRLRLAQHNAEKTSYEPNTKTFLRDVREVAMLLPAETAGAL